MNTASNQIEAAASAWASLLEAPPAGMNQHIALLTHSIGSLATRAPVGGRALPPSAVEPCAARISAALQRLQRMTADPATRQHAMQATADEMMTDLADWLETIKEQSSCH